ncbi:class I SAM-dependent methyltransferase [Pseudoalteromonas obscura]|uniref:Methyltransferase domain-containing protein n=1 Tax=Pseudoalteromonas obscura TaxID=3048491 RepID=A0ABT7EGJ6_9GAMM|nr:methyltransferase domain-containing protein [Pseudoalteromonas sp. P94(2023)]MDK2594148.1 methyltransferase domain-containing protein [Pseudoalteromonas sp. P94(2023)]
MSQCIWSKSAEQYAKSAPKISFYRDTAKFSAEILDKYDYKNFVDLGCGSSNLIANALLRGKPHRQLTCTDAATGMIEVAKRHNIHPNAKYLAVNSEHIQFESNSQCCFLANSAFWMFDFEDTLSRIRAQLKCNGGLLVNFSEWDLQDGTQDKLRYQLIDQQLALGGFSNKVHRGAAKKYCQNKLIDIIKSHGFSVPEVLTKRVIVTKTDWIEFYKIPAIANKSLPHLTLTDAQRTLHLAMKALPDDYQHTMQWLYIKAIKMPRALSK